MIHRARSGGDADPRRSGGFLRAPAHGRQFTYLVGSHARDPVTDGERVVDPTAKARRVGESPARWIGREASPFVPRHEEQPSCGVLAAEVPTPAIRKDGIANLVNLP